MQTGLLKVMSESVRMVMSESVRKVMSESVRKVMSESVRKVSICDIITKSCVGKASPERPWG